VGLVNGTQRCFAELLSIRSAALEDLSAGEDFFNVFSSVTRDLLGHRVPITDDPLSIADSDAVTDAA
jgi:hypothetical protein